MTRHRNPRLKTLFWDPTPFGHHRRYLQAVVDTAPDGMDLVLPSWFEDSARHPASVVFVDQSADDEYRELRRCIDSTGPDVVIIGRGHELVRRIAVAPRHPNCAIVAIDLRCVTAAIDPGFRASRLDYPKALIDVGLREVSVRRGDMRYLSLIPNAVVGSQRLRSNSDWYRDPLEQVETHPSCSTARPRKRILLAGVLVGRKGIIDLARAVTELPPSVRSEVEVVYAGEPHAEGHQELAAAVELLEEEHIAVRTLPRKSAPDEFASLIATTDVLALPYRSHKGGSGLLGTGLVSSTAQIVMSDYGWSGEIAMATDVITFPDGDVSALTDALAEALSRGNREAPTHRDDLTSYYGTDQSFGEHVWSLVDQVR